MGPMYHLVEAQDRHRALSEAFRVLIPGGRLFAVGISRFVSTINGLDSGYFLDPVFKNIMLQYLKDGQHRNPTPNPAYFTDACFHHPGELKAELEAAGFQSTILLSIEGILYLVGDLDEHWMIEDRRNFFLELIDRIAQEPTLIGASHHIMCVGSKP